MSAFAPGADNTPTIASSKLRLRPALFREKESITVYWDWFIPNFTVFSAENLAYEQ